MKNYGLLRLQNNLILSVSLDILGQAQNPEIESMVVCFFFKSDDDDREYEVVRWEKKCSITTKSYDSDQHFQPDSFGKKKGLAYIFT